MDAQSLLKQYYGHAAFRPGQRELIDAATAGRDVLGVMPTGAGKSVCYQLPALLLPGVTLVVSPLIALMKDQVTALTQMGIPAAYINSSLTTEAYFDTVDRMREGAYKIIYVAPERLLSPSFLDVMHGMEVSLVAVDEAHCVSQWGQDFRPSYLQIAAFIGRLRRRPVVGAFTATATERVRDDIIRLLGLAEPLCVTTGFDRPNLYFDVRTPKNKAAWLADYILRRPEQSGIVYCATRKAVESVCDGLRRQHISATRYHAGLDDDERRQNQEDFVYDRAAVMVATNAFGMGIDKSSIGYVVHYNMPKDIESYYQEAGRAGRDGEPAQCVLLFSAGDVRTARFLIGSAAENESLPEETAEIVRLGQLRRLRQMEDYCRTGKCYRAALLRYFGEDAPERCDNCGNCRGGTHETDITVTAQKILSGVARVERQYRSGLGVTLITQMLRGSREQRILSLGLDRLSTYGVLRDVDRTRVRAYIDCLIAQGYLYLTDGEYPVLRLTERAGDVLFRGERVVYVSREAPAERKPAAATGTKKADAIMPDADTPDAAVDGLYESLRALRLSVAQREGVPAYVVFTNAALADMARKRPRTVGELLQVSGVGEVKAGRYGAEFLRAIEAWEREHENA